MSHDVFVCHPTENKSVADAMVARLEAGGIRCWVAPRDIVPGSDFVVSIVEAISASKLLVVVFGAAANTSPHVMREVKQAVESGIPVVPFRVEEVEPSPRLGYLIGPSHWLDATTPPLEEHLDRLRTVVQGFLDSPVEAAEGPPAVVSGRPSPPLVKRRRLSWPWVAGTLVAVALGLWVVAAGGGESSQPDVPGDELGSDVSEITVAVAAVSEITVAVAAVETTGLAAPGRQLIIGAAADVMGEGLILAVGADFATDPDGDAAAWMSSDGGRTWERISDGLDSEAGTQVMTGIAGGQGGIVAVGYEIPPEGPSNQADPVVWRLTPREGFLDGPDTEWVPGPWERAWSGGSSGEGRSVQMLDVVSGAYGLTAVGWDNLWGAAVWRSVDGVDWERDEAYLPEGIDTWMAGVAEVVFDGRSVLVAVGAKHQTPQLWSSVDGGASWQSEPAASLGVEGEDNWALLTAVVDGLPTLAGGANFVVGSTLNTPVVWASSEQLLDSLRTGDPNRWELVRVGAVGSFNHQGQGFLEGKPLGPLWGSNQDYVSADGVVVYDAVLLPEEGRLLLIGQQPGEDGELDPAVWEVTAG